MFELNKEKALEIIYFIDKYHDPRYWIIFGVLSAIFLLEIFLPKKIQFENNFDKVFTYFKVSILFFVGLILFSQGFLGGCVIQIPQNWLAQKFLDRPYWYPYGLVYRENLPESFWPMLRIIYILFSILYYLVFYIFLDKRVWLKKNNQ